MSENEPEPASWKDWDHTGYREIIRPGSYFDWQENLNSKPKDIKDED